MRATVVAFAVGQTGREQHEVGHFAVEQLLHCLRQRAPDDADVRLLEAPRDGRRPLGIVLDEQYAGRRRARPARACERIAADPPPCARPRSPRPRRTRSRAGDPPRAASRSARRPAARFTRPVHTDAIADGSPSPAAVPMTRSSGRSPSGVSAGSSSRWPSRTSYPSASRAALRRSASRGCRQDDRRSGPRRRPRRRALPSPACA